MAANSKIEWTDHTFNPWRGCQHAVLADGSEHPGCAHCYAEAMSGRNPGTLGKWGESGTRVRASDAMWRQPLKWNQEAEESGIRRRVFCASLADVFEDWQGPILNHVGNRVCFCNQPGCGLMGAEEPMLVCPQCGNQEARWATLADLRADLFRLIDETPALDWLLLTKRPQNVARMWLCPLDYEPCNLRHQRPNVWLGTSISNQETTDLLIPELLRSRYLVPVLFLSIEPLLGKIDLSRWMHGFDVSRDEDGRDLGSASGGSDIDWVIVGGESGANARPMHPDWVRSLHDQCLEAGVPFFFKQWGENIPYDQVTTEDQRIRWSKAASAGKQSYFGYRIVHGPQGLKTDGTPGIMPVGYAPIGKKSAGRLLNGREWSEFPQREAATN